MNFSLMGRIKDRVVSFFKGIVEGIAVAIFALLMLVVVVGSFVWWLMPWHRARVKAEVDRLRAKEKADELRRRLEEEKAKRDAEAAYRETAIKAKAAADLEGDPVSVANEIIKGR